jgi:hypothetical protein
MTIKSFQMLHNQQVIETKQYFQEIVVVLRNIFTLIWARIYSAMEFYNVYIIAIIT